jgi:uncharacterized protein YybS (DUF2232 family)
MVCLSNSGPGWEVSPDNILLLFYFTILSVILTLINLFLSISCLKNFSNYFSKFKFCYIAYLIFSIVLIAFIFLSGAFKGQFWSEGFPALIFFAAANIANIVLLALSLIGFRSKRE